LLQFLEVKRYPKLFQQLHPLTSQETTDSAAAEKLGATRPNKLQSFSELEIDFLNPREGVDTTLPIKVEAARFKQDAEMQIANYTIKGSAQTRSRALHRCNQSF
jgi:hypothetical protein